MQFNIQQRELSAGNDLPEDLHPVLKRIYAARNVRTAAELEYSLNTLHPFTELSGIDQAVTLLADYLSRDQKILIVADFDADGATSCAVAIRGLKAMGAGNISYVVPNRFEFGYGLSPEIVNVAMELDPDVIITVDNGIASIEGVNIARENNIDVIITDHHLPGNKLPDANAIVNPNLPGDKFPSKNLAGVGVMFYILIALRSELRNRNWFQISGIADPNLAELLDLVALGTVADVVPLDRNNRILVAQGLARIRNGFCCEGIRELLKSTNKNPGLISAQDLSFIVAPRLNAAGRLTDMSLGIECLLTGDAVAAKKMSRQLDKLNRERRDIQADMHQQALAELDNIQLDSDQDLPNGLCLYNEDWHQGIVGIVAARIKDQYNRPVIAFAPDKDGFIKGSARSLQGMHIRDVLDSIANQHPDIINKFGGHAMAAGLTIREDSLEEFKQLFNEMVTTFMPEDGLGKTLLSDGELAVDDMSYDLAEKILESGPWGQGFPEPMFEGIFDLVACRIVGEKHLKMQLGFPGKPEKFDAIAFNVTDEEWPGSTVRVKIFYKLDINEFAGKRNLQLVIERISPLDLEIN